MAINGGAACLQKPRVIERLTEENQPLKPRLRYQERQAAEGFFGSGTPSAKRPLNANTTSRQGAKRKGAQPGHPGAGRQTFEARAAARVVDVAPEVRARCPDCDAPLEEKGTASRLVLDSRPVKAARGRSRLPKTYCPPCRRLLHPRAPAVLPKSL